MKRDIGSFFHRFAGERRGVVAVIVGLSMLMLLGFLAISIDVGFLIYIRNSLQASTNIAAMAGARYITAGTASSVAISYSAQAGSKNALSSPAVTVTATATLRCLTTVENLASGAVPCNTYGSQAAANAIEVTQTAVVPTIFGVVLGVPSVKIQAAAAAIPQGSGPPPLNVMLILDTTASMNDADQSCTGTGKVNPSRLDCALHGIQVLLSQLAPSVDQVSLMVFPGLTNTSQVPLEYDCSSGTSPKIAAYNASPVYQIISPSTDYRTGSPPAAGLNTSSNLSKTVGAGGSSCAGLIAVGGVGTYYADAITAAQTALAASRQAAQQNVIIILTDGDASASSGNVGTGKASNQCHQAITAAQAATNAGTWVYSIAYGSSTSSSGSCATDMPPISACAALQQIASDETKFYSDAPSVCVSVNAQSALSDIFNGIAGSLSKARLIPSSTT